MATSPLRGKGKSDGPTGSSGNSTPRETQRSAHSSYSQLSGEERKHGYDVELFVDRVGASPYLCCVCMNVVEDCHETTCGHIFCGPCIKRALSSDDQFRCPIDRTTNIEVHPSRFVNRAVCNLTVKCPNHNHGCEWQGPLKDLVDVACKTNTESNNNNKKGLSSATTEKTVSHQRHLEICAYARIICENCGMSVSRMSYHEHSSACASTCPFCSKHIGSDEASSSQKGGSTHAHIEMCPLAVVECPEGCKATMKREDVSRHLQEDCRERMVTCPYACVGCSARVKLKHVQNHLKYNASWHTQMKVDHTCDVVDKNSKNMEMLSKQVDVLTHKLELMTEKCAHLEMDLSNVNQEKNKVNSKSDMTNNGMEGGGGANASGNVSVASCSCDGAPDVLILRGNNQWEVTGIFIRRSKYHAGRVCYTLTHGPCAIRWHPTLSAWLIDRRGLKYDQEASLIAYEDVSHPGCVKAPWYVFHADQHRWIESESYRVESCNLAELFFKCETICPEYCLPMSTPNGNGAAHGNGGGGGGAVNMRSSGATNGNSLFVLNGGANPGGGEQEQMFGDDLDKHDFRHHQPPGLASNGVGAGGGGVQPNGLIPKENDENANRQRRAKKSWRKLEVDFQ